ncbi:MAG: integrin alpha [Gammaproteobacteria bacterium]
MLELSSLNGANGFRANGVTASDYSGRAISGLGDVNGDGLDDFIIGAPGASPSGNSLAGSSYVVFGRKPAVVGNAIFQSGFE